MCSVIFTSLFKLSTPSSFVSGFFACFLPMFVLKLGLSVLKKSIGIKYYIERFEKWDKGDAMILVIQIYDKSLSRNDENHQSRNYDNFRCIACPIDALMIGDEFGERINEIGWRWERQGKGKRRDDCDSNRHCGGRNMKTCFKAEQLCCQLPKVETRSKVNLNEPIFSQS